MLEINTETMLIALTRDDSASITFGAKDKNGKTWNPSANTDKLKFSVSKKWGAEPLFEIVNTYDGVIAYKEVSIDEETFDAEKTLYYTESGGEYTRCTDEDVYDSTKTYYVLDCDDYWTINITKSNAWDVAAEKLGSEMKFGDYVYDVEVLTTSGADTIIGKTDDINPTFRVWGESATE